MKTRETSLEDHETPSRAFSPRDVLAGISVALILIPQALAYAELAGMPPEVGLYAAAVPPVVAALAASSPYLQTGPVALTSLLTLGALLPLAEPGTATYVGMGALLALIVGLTRLGLGLLKLGLLAYLMSQPLLIGFTSAAGILIVLSQLPSALGVAPPSEGVVTGGLWALIHAGEWSWPAVALAGGAVLLIRVGGRIHRLFPGVLLATAGGLLYSVLGDYGGRTLGSLPTGLSIPGLDLPWSTLPHLLVPGVVIGLVGFVEHASIARTYATADQEPWDPNREFLSQGMANLASGVFGAFPVGGSFSRSGIVRIAGGRSRWSGAVAGIGVILFLPFADHLGPLPVAILAGIIIASVLGLIRMGHLVKLWRLSRAQAITSWVTFFLTLALAPRVDQAIVLGILTSVGVHLWRELPVAFDTWRDGDTIHLALRGVLWFGSAPAVEQAVRSAVKEYDQAQTLAIHLEGVGRLDLTGALMLQKVIEDPALAHLNVRLEGVPEHAHRILGNVMDWTPAGGVESQQEIRRKVQRLRAQGPESPVPPSGRRVGESPSALRGPSSGNRASAEGTSRGEDGEGPSRGDEP